MNGIVAVPTLVENWTGDDVQHWLQENHFEQWKEAFSQAGINGPVLQLLDEPHLEYELGMTPLAERERFMQAKRLLVSEGRVYKCLA